jgi:hypothetical protein
VWRVPAWKGGPHHVAAGAEDEGGCKDLQDRHTATNLEGLEALLRVAKERTEDLFELHLAELEFPEACLSKRRPVGGVEERPLRCGTRRLAPTSSQRTYVL